MLRGPSSQLQVLQFFGATRIFFDSGNAVFPHLFSNKESLMTLKLIATVLAFTISTAAMAREYRPHSEVLPGWGYTLSYKDLKPWNRNLARCYYTDRNLHFVCKALW
jgi:hypothetical protein